MASPDFDRNQPNRNPGNPERAKDTRIPKVVDELSRSARLLSDPRSLSLKSSPEKPPATIEYKSADGEMSVTMDKEFFTWASFTLSDMPGIIDRLGVGNERLTPLRVSRIGHDDIDDPEFLDYIVWTDLNRENPRIFQLVYENEDHETANEIPAEDLLEAAMSGWELTGEELIIERQEFLEPIVRAVSGKKRVQKDEIQRYAPEWTDTFNADEPK